MLGKPFIYNCWVLLRPVRMELLFAKTRLALNKHCELEQPCWSHHGNGRGTWSIMKVNFAKARPLFQPNSCGCNNGPAGQDKTTWINYGPRVQLHVTWACLPVAWSNPSSASNLVSHPILQLPCQKRPLPPAYKCLRGDKPYGRGDSERWLTRDIQARPSRFGAPGSSILHVPSHFIHQIQ